MKILRVILRILLILVLIMPVLGVLGVFPAPTADMYPPNGWAFMSALMAVGYMMPLVGATCAVCAVLLAINRTALAAIILAPFTVNVVLFHIFAEYGLFHPSAILADLLLILNAFFLWTERKKYKALW